MGENLPPRFSKTVEVIGGGPLDFRRLWPRKGKFAVFENRGFWNPQVAPFSGGFGREKVNPRFSETAVFENRGLAFLAALGPKKTKKQLPFHFCGENYPNGFQKPLR